LMQQQQHMASSFKKRTYLHGNQLASESEAANDRRPHAHRAPERGDTMRHKNIFFTIATTCATLALFAGSTLSASAQVGNFGYGSSTAAGSGGAPTGPTNLGGIYGLSSSSGSGGASTGLTDPGIFGNGLSTNGGSGGTPTGPTNPILPQFGGTAAPAIGIGAPATGSTVGTGGTPGMSSTLGLGVTTPATLGSTPGRAMPGVVTTSGMGSTLGLGGSIPGTLGTTPGAVAIPGLVNTTPGRGATR
jgi:hypothetical protein